MTRYCDENNTCETDRQVSWSSFCAVLYDVLFFTNSTAAGARTSIEINREIKAWLNAEAISNSHFEQAEWIYAMMELFSRIMQHPKLSINPTLNGHCVVLRSRMLHVRDELQRKLLRAERSGEIDNIVCW